MIAADGAKPPQSNPPDDAGDPGGAGHPRRRFGQVSWQAAGVLVAGVLLLANAGWIGWMQFRPSPPMPDELAALEAAQRQNMAALRDMRVALDALNDRIAGEWLAIWRDGSPDRRTALVAALLDEPPDASNELLARLLRQADGELLDALAPVVAKRSATAPRPGGDPADRRVAMLRAIGHGD